MGTLVYLPGTKTVAEVIDGPNEKEQLLLRAGAIKCWVLARDLKLAPKKRASKSTLKKIQSSATADTVTVDLHGLTKQEATEKLITVIDRAILAGTSRIEIIHGRGSGALKAAVNETLSGLSAVKNHRLDENNPGTTWAYL